MALAEDVRRLAEGFSIEVVPREAARLGDLRAHLPEGTRVFIAWTPGAETGGLIEAAARLRGQGMEPVPHLVARRIRSEAALRELLERLAEAAALREVLVVAGDAGRAAGPFAGSMDLLATGLLEAHGIARIAVGAHPEGHPRIGDSQLRQALAAKAAYAADSPAEMAIVTQFVFSGRPVVRWLDGAKAAHAPDLPVAAGLPGLTTARNLMRFARACGVGGSLGVLMRNAGTVFRLAQVVAPDRSVVELARAAAERPERGLASLHFYPFGGFRRTAAWARALAEGRFRLAGDGRRLEVGGD